MRSLVLNEDDNTVKSLYSFDSVQINEMKEKLKNCDFNLNQKLHITPKIIQTLTKIQNR